MLDETGQSNMEKALNSLPADEIEAYKLIINRIKAAGCHTSDTAMRTLTWIFYAARPLLMSELREVLWFEERLAGDPTLVTYDIIEMCQSLVVHEESSGVVRFIHPTVQDYLKSVELFPVINLAETCLKYLENNAFDDICFEEKFMEARVENYRFCLYAAKFWAFHIRGKLETSMQKAVFRLLQSENKRNSILQMATYADRIWDSLSFTKRLTMLHVIAANGLTKICTHLLNEKLTYALHGSGC